jgi:DNA-binding NarL/FixJ family response regulator
MQNPTNQKLLMFTQEPLLFAGVQAIFRSHGMQDLTRTQSLSEMVQIASNYDLVIIDFNPQMPMAKLKEITNQAKVFLLINIVNIHTLRAVLDLKVLGILRKTSSVEELLRCVEMMIEGVSFIDPAITKILSLEQEEPFTNREWQILELIGHDKTNREIQEILHISPKGINVYLSRIYRKVGFAGNRKRAMLKMIMAFTLDESMVMATTGADAVLVSVE